MKIVPRDEAKMAVHYTNLQSLWAADNTAKGAQVL